MKKRLHILFMALLAMAVLGGCGADGTGESSEDTSCKEQNVQETEISEGPVYGGSVVVGIQQDIDSLDPHKATAAGTKEILFNVFEGLVKPDENGNLICAVASDYSISDDGLVYTFTLRDGVKFHNGNDVTCEDVKYSLERVAGLLDGTPLVATLQTIQAVDILDDKTVQVTVDTPNTELIYSFVTAIIPAGSGEDAEADPVGTGPFSFVSYTPQEGIVLAKNENYWQEGLPYLDEVDFKIVGSADTALLELQGGSIDIYAYLTDSQANELKDSFNVISSPSNVVQALFLNNDYEPLSDVKVRQAICYALDKDMVNEFVAGGNGTLISSAMLPTLKDYYEDLNDLYGTSANVEKAKELLTEAGYADGFDLAIALGILTATEILDAKVLADVFVIGELGLSGEIKGVKGVLPLVWEAFRQGKKQCLVPRDNYAEASVIEGIRVAGVGSIQEACDYLQLSEEEQIKEELKQRRQEAEAQREWKKRDHRQEEKALDFAEVHGQENLKRGALIAAAGFHHMLIVGPPGAGKTMIAKRIPSILPELSFEESMEVTSIYSIAGRLPKGQNLIKKRPFLNPHHSVTIHALAGGGRIPQPGLVSLAHRGVLFLDELPEFQRQTIDLLRQPLEDKEIHIARSTGAFTYPADFMLVGAMNPCPCGYYPDRNRCKCTPFERHLYRSRLSGPILDRMDLCLEAEKVEIGQLQKKKSGLSSAEMREMVNRARELQESRYNGTDIKFNSDLTMKDCEKYCCLGKQEQSYTERLSKKMQLSARGYHHLLKVARTIADLEGSEEIRLPHLAEAMSYRNMEPER